MFCERWEFHLSNSVGNFFLFSSRTFLSLRSSGSSVLARIESFGGGKVNQIISIFNFSFNIYWNNILMFQSSYPEVWWWNFFLRLSQEKVVNESLLRLEGKVIRELFMNKDACWKSWRKNNKRVDSTWNCRPRSEWKNNSKLFVGTRRAFWRGAPVSKQGRFEISEIFD